LASFVRCWQAFHGTSGFEQDAEAAEATGGEWDESWKWGYSIHDSTHCRLWSQATETTPSTASAARTVVKCIALILLKNPLFFENTHNRGKMLKKPTHPNDPHAILLMRLGCFGGVFKC